MSISSRPVFTAHAVRCAADTGTVVAKTFAGGWEATGEQLGPVFEFT